MSMSNEGTLLCDRKISKREKTKVAVEIKMLEKLIRLRFPKTLLKTSGIEYRPQSIIQILFSDIPGKTRLETQIIPSNE